MFVFFFFPPWMSLILLKKFIERFWMGPSILKGPVLHISVQMHSWKQSENELYIILKMSTR